MPEVAARVMAPARSDAGRNERRRESDALRGVAIIDGDLSPKCRSASFDGQLAVTD